MGYSPPPARVQASSIGGQLSMSVSLQTRQKGRTSAETRRLLSVSARGELPSGVLRPSAAAGICSREEEADL